MRVLIGVALGALLGVVGGDEPYLWGLRNDHLGQLGMLVIRLLKALAVPLILFAILDAFTRTHISAKSGGRLVTICLINVSVACAIGLFLMNVIEPGLAWRDRIEQLTAQVSGNPASGSLKSVPTASLNPLQNLGVYIPQSLIEPLAGNNVISVVLLALLFGAALRWLKDRQGESDIADIRPLEGFVSSAYQVLAKALGWVVEAVPLAVFGLVAQVVGKTGLEIFADLGGFLGVIALGLCLQGLLYYPLAAWLAGGTSPHIYLKQSADAILTGLSANSSLAAMPVTLRCLRNIGVSDSSARIAVCAGTNLNNDGITLYEAMAALFLAQALGYALGAGQQAIIVLSALMAGVGVAGIPEAGLIILPLVLSASGLPETVVAAAIPLIAPVDWILARLRSGVNVLADMLVAILLDAWEKRAPDHKKRRSRT
ncbi:dicarboxylate/amino acid:cation symporter [Methylocaldum sp.]|uniref:dicarboxylate/amino acid:cation symporter n=1 Tax=Methylocaldum sp. TaxID=1969727 RepID=UPI002D5A19DF|nr:dicarboxylate/amino acid:cation symporter [Methylocaldum sp.]HYE37678.1 dicarboxylate/amino acid:cation symporter [Methylocaldum sp.]